MFFIQHEGVLLMATQHQFNTEIKQLLDLMIHSLYSHKEIFLRELISNASDAIDKLRFESLTQADLIPSGYEAQIRLEANPEQKTLKIFDNGIGMTSEEVKTFIGTIAHSGTKKFVQMSEEMKQRPELIGQFGVGFYSAFMVADKVTLHTQKAGTNDGTIWESQGDGTYTLTEIPRPQGTGTTITLHLKTFAEEEQVQDFTSPWVLKSLVKKYSDFIAHPIKMLSEEKTEDGKTESKDEVLNSQKALWLKSASEVTQEEYTEFYKHLTHDWNAPAKTIHYRAEGTMEFNALLYIPEQKPWNYQYKDSEFGLSLYVKRVFIMADSKDLVPSYLRFVKGLVDSSDLSLNVSREILQQNRQVTQIKKNVVTKVLGGLKDMLTKERETYEKFWNEFGSTLKEGLPQDPSNKEKLQDLLLFASSTSEKVTTLDEYVLRMKETQKDIFYITGENKHQVQNSPYLEKLNEKGYEVLFLIDPVDEWVVDSMTEFKGKKLQNIMKEGLDLDTEEEKKSKEQDKKSDLEKYSALLSEMKEHLSTNVKDVIISDRLSSTPVCLVAGSHDPSAYMERLLSKMGPGVGEIPNAKRILEINPKHPLFEKMMTSPNDKKKLWSEILYSQALLNEGSPLPDPAKFSKQISELMIQG